MIREVMVNMVREQPGINGLTLQYDVRRHTMASRDAVSIEFLQLLNYGYLTLDGEHRVWLGSQEFTE